MTKSNVSTGGIGIVGDDDKRIEEWIHCLKLRLPTHLWPDDRSLPHASETRRHQEDTREAQAGWWARQSGETAVYPSRSTSVYLLDETGIGTYPGLCVSLRRICRPAVPNIADTGGLLRFVGEST